MLLGKKAEVESSPNETLVGLKGTIVSETMNCIVLETNVGLRKVLKNNVIFKIDGCSIDGLKIGRRPHERLIKNGK